MGQILVCDPLSVHVEGAPGDTARLRFSSSIFCKHYPTLTNFMYFSVVVLLLSPKKVQKKHSSAAVSEADKYNMQKFTNCFSLGDGDLWRTIIWTTACGCDCLPYLFFWSIPVHTGHPEACITSDSCWIHLETLHQVVQTSWIRFLHSYPSSVMPWRITQLQFDIY